VAVPPPAPHEQRQEHHDKRPGEPDHRENRQITEALRRRGWSGDQDLQQKKERGQPVQVGDVEPDLAGVRAKDKR
jgi:hypothetical protein